MDMLAGVIEDGEEYKRTLPTNYSIDEVTYLFTEVDKILNLKFPPTVVYCCEGGLKIISVPRASAWSLLQVWIPPCRGYTRIPHVLIPPLGENLYEPSPEDLAFEMLKLNNYTEEDYKNYRESFITL